jgi:hypothetical protein
MCLMNLSIAYARRKTLVDVNKGVGLLEEAEQLIELEEALFRSVDSHISFKNWANLTAVLLDRYALEHVDTDLDRVISISKRAIEQLRTGDPMRSDFLRRLGRALNEEFKAQEPRGEGSDNDGEIDFKDIDDTIENLCKFIKIEAQGVLDRSAELAQAHSPAESMWQERFGMSKTLDDMNNAIASLRQADVLNASKVGDFLFNLATALMCKVLRTHSLEDLDNAVAIYQKSLQFLGEDSSRYGLYLYNLLEALQLRYRIRLLTRDLDLAINTGELATTLLLEDSSRGVILTRLIKAYLTRFGRTRSADVDKSSEERTEVLTTDLDRAIKARRLALPLVSNEPFLAHRVISLIEPRKDDDD